MSEVVSITKKVVIRLSTDELQGLMSTDAHLIALGVYDERFDRLLTDGDLVFVSFDQDREEVKLTFSGFEIEED